VAGCVDALEPASSLKRARGGRFTDTTRKADTGETAIHRKEDPQMIVRKIFLGAAAAALTSSPAWALPAVAPANPGSGHSHSGTKGSEGKKSGEKGANHGKSHKCAPHKVGYVAGGSLEAQSLTENSDGTFSGELEVLVAHTNHHAKRDKGNVVTYSVENVHVTFGMADTNADGTVGFDDVAKGDRAHLLGRISVLAPKCPKGEFTQVMKIHRIIFHQALPPASSEDSSNTEGS
jgi:hypothetical protein